LVTHPTLGAEPEHCLTVAVAGELMSTGRMGMLSMQAEWLAKRA
jgi:hypothetical protein